jgi:hypothetical protein
MRFEGDPLLVSVLRTSYPIARLRDRWGDCWECNKGTVYPSNMQADWLSQSPRVPEPRVKTEANALTGH